MKQPLALAFTLVLAIFAVSAGPAFGASPRPHEFSEAFGKLCQSASCVGEELKSPEGVAVNEASGDVYVVDKGEPSTGGEEPALGGRVVRFNGAGEFQSEVTGPSATGTAKTTEGSTSIEAMAMTGAFSPNEEISGEGIPAGTTIETVAGATLTLSQAVTGESKIGVSVTAHQNFETPETIAVDNSCVLRKLTDPSLTQVTCEAEDPSNGDVYVVDQGPVHPGKHLVVDKFSASGGYLGQISEVEDLEHFSKHEVISERFSHTLNGVAVDPSGKLWIYYQEGFTVDGYTNARANEFVSVTPLNGFVDTAFPGLAIDSHGNFYVRHGTGSEPAGRIAKVSPEGTILNLELDSKPSPAVAVEQTTDNPSICNTTTVAVFDLSGKLLETLGEEAGAKHLTECAGIAVNASAGSLYVSDVATGTVTIFGVQQATTPEVHAESFANVTSSTATLGAEINPRSEPNEEPTKYRFEYGICSSLGQCPESGYEASVPAPEGQISPDFNVHSVSAEAQELKPDTTYHFRAIATNGHGAGAPGEERTFTTEGAGGELKLPDNRGWELVSPPDKQGTRIEALSDSGVVEAAASGDGITYSATAPTEAQPQSYATQVLSRRSADAWSTKDLAVPHAATTGSGGSPEDKQFDPELQTSAVQPAGPFNPALSGEASESTPYLHHLGESCSSSCFHPLVTGKAPFANVPAGTQFGEDERCTPHGGLASVVCGPEVLGASEDLSHVVLSSNAELIPGTGRGQLYEWGAGMLSPVSVLPGAAKEPAPQSGLGLENQAARRAISTDGSRVVWGTPLRKPGAALYLRDTARGETLQLDAAQGGSESGEGEFQIANTTGSRIFFTDERALTEHSGAGGTGNNKADLYECSVPPGKLACQLTDLTPEHGEEPADVQGSVLGASEDGSYLYFVAKGVLSEAPNSRGQRAVAKEPNLYLEHEGSTSFIATLPGGDAHDWETAPARQPTRVSNNGQFLELMSQAQPTGYDNSDLATGKPVAEVYLYDAAANRLSCASCNPSGARPVGIEYRKLEPDNGGLVGGPRDVWPLTALVGANVPGWTAINIIPYSRYQDRYLSDSGRLFFNTAARLVPQDGNGTQDVYEYEPLGIKGPENEEDCTSAMSTFSARSGGCVSLISSGSSAKESAFLDASESGDDVFFLTSAKLSPLDVDPSADVYDAHVCSTGSPCITFPTTQVPPCTTEASCKASPSPQPAVFGAPPSATFQGLGNPVAPAAVVKAKAKPLTRAQKLSKALVACHKDRKKAKRQACEKSARKKYGPLKKKSRPKK